MCVLLSLKKLFSLIIRGEKTDNAVICSDCETFEIKEVECSNTTFLAQDLQIPSKKEIHTRTDSPNLLVATVILGRFCARIKMVWSGMSHLLALDQFFLGFEAG